MAETSVQEFVDQGKSAFAQGNYAAAAQAFRQAADWYTGHGQACEAAEMKNNLSVALLQDKKAQEALQAVLGTAQVFEQAGDFRLQGMAFGNQAAALEALGRLEEAAAAYDRSAELLGQAGEGDMQALVLRSAGSLRARRGKIYDSAIAMFGALDAVENPTWIQRLLKFIVRLLPH